MDKDVSLKDRLLGKMPCGEGDGFGPNRACDMDSGSCGYEGGGLDRMPKGREGDQQKGPCHGRNDYDYDDCYDEALKKGGFGGERGEGGGGGERGGMGRGGMGEGRGEGRGGEMDGDTGGGMGVGERGTEEGLGRGRGGEMDGDTGGGMGERERGTGAGIGGARGGAMQERMQRGKDTRSDEAKGKTMRRGMDSSTPKLEGRLIPIHFL